MVLALPMALAGWGRRHLIGGAAEARLSRHAAVVHGLICCQMQGIGPEVLRGGADSIVTYLPVGFEDAYTSRPVLGRQRWRGS